MALRAVLDHPKLLHLQALLEIPRYAAVGILETLWHFTGRFTPQGNIGKYSDRQIEVWLGWDSAKENSLIQALVESGWLDAHPDHRLIVHDWHNHCDDATRKFLGRAKLQFAVETNDKVSADLPTPSRHVPTCPDMSGPPEPEPEPEPEPGPEPGPAGGKSESGGFRFKTSQLEAAFTELWRIWPHRAGDPKQPAMRKFAEVAKNADLDEVLEGARRFAAFQKAIGNIEQGKGNQFVPMLRTWLHGRCWMDDYEIVEGTVAGGVSVKSVVEKAAEIQREIQARYGTS